MKNHESDSEGDEELNLLMRKFKRNLKKLEYGKIVKFKGKDKAKLNVVFKKLRRYK